MISQRIRQARTVCGFSQDEVVQALSQRGVALTKAALSKYERGTSVPRATLLNHLGAVLNVAPEYFLHETQVNVVWLAFRIRASATAGARERERFQAIARERVEAYLNLHETLVPEKPHCFPPREKVSSPTEAEQAAEHLRLVWQLGDRPVASMTETIEDHDGIVVELAGAGEAVDGLAGIANDCHPVVAVDPGVPDDRKRFTLAHELGHLLMDTASVQTPKDIERLANRFASAFIVPASVARRELGAKRPRLSLDELELLKTKHGLSMQAWLYRARDCAIIDEAHFNTLFDRLTRAHGRRTEPVEFRGRERPVRFRQMVLRALAEGIVDRAQARRWCPELAIPAPATTAMAAATLRHMPAEQRDALLAAVAEDAAETYRTDPALRGFDAPELLEGEKS